MLCATLVFWTGLVFLCWPRRVSVGVSFSPTWHGRFLLLPHMCVCINVCLKQACFSGTWSRCAWHLSNIPVYPLASREHMLCSPLSMLYSSPKLIPAVSNQFPMNCLLFLRAPLDFVSLSVCLFFFHIHSLLWGKIVCTSVGYCQHIVEMSLVTLSDFQLAFVFLRGMEGRHVFIRVGVAFPIP